MGCLKKVVTIEAEFFEYSCEINKVVGVSE
jgi:hypothetical protein